MNMMRLLVLSLLVLLTVEQCGDGCIVCGEDVCTSCEEHDGYYLANQQGGICCNTKENSFPDENDGCQSCQALRAECQTCEYDLGNRQVVCKTCPVNQFLDRQGGCAPCDEIIPGCSGCLDFGEIMQCAECMNGYQLTTYSAECCDTSQGLYADFENGCSLCSDAEEGCISCQIDSTNVLCQSCNQEEGYSLSGSQCCSSKAGEFPGEGGECLLCTTIPNCSECSYQSGSISCSTCKQNYQPDGNGGCIQCSTGCTACSQSQGNMECSSCAQGYELSGSTCCDVSSEFPDGEGSCKACSELIPSCPSCEYQSSSSTSVCTDCSSIIANCEKCSDSSTCISCQQGYAHTSPSTCTLCTEGQVLSHSGDACITCSEINKNCLACTDQNTCTSCSSGHELSSDGSTCYSCSNIDPECTSCSNGQCQSCSDGFIWDGSSCSKCGNFCEQCSGVSQCGECSLGFTAKEGVCIKCQVGCTHCQSSDISVCLSCGDGFFEKDGTCHSCPLGCFRCSDDSTCSACLPGFNLNTNTCSPCSGWDCERCSSGFYEEITSEGKGTGECKACSTQHHCSECQGDADQCTACEADYEFLGFACVLKTRIQFDLTLETSFSDFKTKTDDFKRAFMEALNHSDYTGKMELLNIVSLTQGSTKINAQLSVYETSAISIYKKLSDFSDTNSISSEFPVISLENKNAIGFTPPITQISETEAAQFPIYAIILLIVVPLIIIAIVLRFIVCRQTEGSEYETETETVTTESSKPTTTNIKSNAQIMVDNEM